MFTKPIDKRDLLSILWVVVMLSLIKADVLSLFIPGTAEELAKTAARTGTAIRQLMLFGAVIGSIGLAMIPLSRILSRGVNRWLNLVVSPLYILYIVGGGVSYPHYLFLAALEVVCLALIFWHALKWPASEP